MSRTVVSLAAATLLALLGGISAIGAQTLADLSLTKTDAPDPVSVGADLTYTLTASNHGTGVFKTATVSDTLPAGTTFVSLASPAGWTCVMPAVGGTGTISCDATPFAVGDALFSLVVQVGQTSGASLTNQARLDVTDSGRTTTLVASATTQVVVPVTVSGTKVWGGLTTLMAGSPVDYTVMLTNNGSGTQGDNPGNEFIDVLPASLTLLSASATSGTVVAFLPTRTVTWNGSLPGEASVTIIIHAMINGNVADGTVISNQGTIAYDADGNGTNEATAMTDDPRTPGAADPTTFQVQGPDVFPVPTLGGAGLLLLAMLLAVGGAVMLRKRRA
jgi:uncharacterized repeat protein (TIGR01451 family)